MSVIARSNKERKSCKEKIGFVDTVKAGAYGSVFSANRKYIIKNKKVMQKTKKVIET